MNALSIGASAGIEAIRRRQAIRVYAETPALKLLFMVDKFDARVQWKTRVGKPILDSEKKTLEDQLLAAQLELKLQGKALADAIEARSRAEQMAAKLVAQFGVVVQVFDDARQLAIDSGLYTKATEDKPGMLEAKAAIDRAVANG